MSGIEEWSPLGEDCPNCDEGTLWRQNGDGAAYCNECGCSVSAYVVEDGRASACGYTSKLRTHYVIRSRHIPFGGVA